ncbi:Acetyl-CoA acetyltransferase, cytosolic [Datura stramonium]|uniref:Acetyl-CoA acetyltransferase, cytosolic n=1 Tax=Datura stramonium TaxID=4076 RepID=A0ABS8RL27_DATST|nr:Acetyl-CoA acetyltransferase, cytosolic [Datura stramonium]
MAPAAADTIKPRVFAPICGFHSEVLILYGQLDIWSRNAKASNAHCKMFALLVPSYSNGSFLGSLSSLPATKLGSIAIEGALKKANVDPSLVEEVFFGNVLSANLGQAPLQRISAALGAGIPNTVICTTVNKVCASGLKGMDLPVVLISWRPLPPFITLKVLQLGINEVVVAGGMESMSNVPKYIAEARKGSRLGHDSLVDGMLKDGLTDVYKDCGMGVCAEICADKHKITREEQDDYAVQSFERGIAAQEAGAFHGEIVPVEVPGGRGKPSIIVDKDDGLGKFDGAKLRKLRPSFKEKDGTVTAGNASSISDGAAALVLAITDAAQEPELFTTAPALAIPKAIKSASLEASQIDYYEINEAFAVKSLTNQKLLGLNPVEKVNVHGGAVSLGHPLGCSGARILVTLLGVLRQKMANMELLAFAMEEEVPQPLSHRNLCNPFCFRLVFGATWCLQRIRSGRDDNATSACFFFKVQAGSISHN